MSEPEIDYRLAAANTVVSRARARLAEARAASREAFRQARASTRGRRECEQRLKLALEIRQTIQESSPKGELPAGAVSADRLEAISAGDQGRLDLWRAIEKEAKVLANRSQRAREWSERNSRGPGG